MTKKVNYGVVRVDPKNPKLALDALHKHILRQIAASDAKKATRDFTLS